MKSVVIRFAFFQLLLLLLYTKKKNVLTVLALQANLKKNAPSSSYRLSRIETCTHVGNACCQQPYLFQRRAQRNSGSTTIAIPVPYHADKEKPASSRTIRLPFSNKSSLQSPLPRPRTCDGDDLYSVSLDFVASRVESSLKKLGVFDATGDSSASSAIESVSSLIVESMMQENRNYHGIRHVIDIVQGLEQSKMRDMTFKKFSQVAHPIAVLAALYHDVVYVQVDEGLSPRLAEILLLNYDNDVSGGKKRGGIIQLDMGFQLEQANCNSTNTEHQQHPQKVNEEEDLLLHMVESIFGLSEHRRQQQQQQQHFLPNEFLSAVVAVRQLQTVGLPMSRLAQIAACIEATIPFRGRLATSKLYENLHRTNERFQLGLSESELVETVHCAAGLANEDVSGFGKDFDTFLANTESLLSESHPSLRQAQYSPGDLIAALEKMIRFFDFLQPHMIFQQFHSVPSTVDLMRQERVAANNLRRARLVLQDILVQLASSSTTAAATASAAREQ